MINYVVKNKDNKYLAINDDGSAYWFEYDIADAFFWSKDHAKQYLNENKDMRSVEIGGMTLKDYECRIVGVEIKEIEEQSFSITPEMFEAAKKSFSNCRAIYEIPKIPKLHQHEDKGE